MVIDKDILKNDIYLQHDLKVLGEYLIFWQFAEGEKVLQKGQMVAYMLILMDGSISVMDEGYVP